MDSNQRLFEAARKCDVDAIASLLREDADVNHADKNGQTALLEAVIFGNFAAIVVLLEAGADVNRGDRYGLTALFHAARGGKVDAIAALLQAGADVNHADNDGQTALFEAARDGTVDAVAALLQAGADVNHADNDGQTALFEAARDGKVDDVAALLQAGADVNHADKHGKTALIQAAEYGEVDVIAALLQAGADVNHADKHGKTALFEAAESGEVDVIAALLQAGADANHAGWDGRTALFEAASYGNVDAIAALLQAGADANHADEYGETALFRGEHNLFHAEIFLNVGDYRIKKYMLQSCISFKKYIIDIVVAHTILGRRDPFNLSLDKFDDSGIMGMFFRYGRNTVVSIHFTNGSPVVSHLKAQAPICAGDGRVIYTRQKPSGESHVYENSIDLADEVELCQSPSLSTNYEKNWGCFGRTGPGNYFIVYSVIPLRIFKVENRTQCSELPSAQMGYACENPPDRVVVKKEYPNFEPIERMFVDGRDSRGTSIFRGGTRGIDFGDEYLFVGHITLHQNPGECFPNWFMRNAYKPSYDRMYFMYFFTVRLASGMFQLSRMSSCFQPPAQYTFHKIIFPCGIARRGTDVVVSFGRDDSDCLITSYSEAHVNTMLAPVHSWDENTYVFHPNYSSSIRSNRGGGGVRLIGTSPDSDGRFNPAITNISGSGNNRFITAWRKMNGSVRTWRGYNQVAMETCSLEIKRGKLVYTSESEIVEFQVGNTDAGGEDPRLITENNCSLLMVNDLDGEGNRRMYVHNLATDHSAMTIHPFCHNMSGRFEKNWGPFYAGGQLFFVYSIDPLVVGKVADGKECPGQTPVNIDCTIVSKVATPLNLRFMFQANGLKMRGGTPGLLFGENEYLFVGHAVQEKTGECFPDFVVQRWVGASDEEVWRKNYPKFYTAFFYTIGKVQNKWVLKRLSCCSHLPEKRQNFTKIHFPAGLARANLGGEFEDAFVVSFGEKDVYGGFCAVNRKFLNYVLRPVREWNVRNYVVDVNYFANVAHIDPQTNTS